MNQPGGGRGDMRASGLRRHGGDAPRGVRRAFRAIALAVVVAASIGGSTSVADAAAPQTFVVNSVVDPGDGTCTVSNCTLREAITAANADAVADSIHFNILGTFVHTI